LTGGFADTIGGEEGSEEKLPMKKAFMGLLEKSVPHIEKVVIPGVAHMLSLEKPAEFDRAVLPFLKKIYGTK
jgi:pimeloyl-ACP methyl ester carboxylesterase